VWVAVVVGLLIVARRRLADPHLMRAAVRGDVPQSVTITTAILCLLALALSFRCATRADIPRPLGSVDAIEDWQALAAWADAERPAVHDLFDHRPIARRLARILAQPLPRDQSIALVGEFGSACVCSRPLFRRNSRTV
jgi:hypothetical protein